jgi:hypothetical protein
MILREADSGGFDANQQELEVSLVRQDELLINAALVAVASSN